MSGERNEHRRLFEEALERATDARAQFLDEACGGDDELRRAIEELLAAHAARRDDTAGHPLPETEIAPNNRVRATDRAEPLANGHLINDRYRVEGVIGSGGMGAVYLARDLKLQRLVALKIIRTDLASHRTMGERFRREAVAIAQLRHRHIVTVHDYGVATDIGAYIVMELLEGRTLRRELADRTRLEPSDAIRLARQICQAVGSAHSAGVIHRDLKPENVVLEDGDAGTAVKVVDFGLAKLEATLLSSDGRLTSGEDVFGTPTYMSPEQCTGEEADARSDVYALGCVLFEMLTGQPPFAARPVVALLYKHLNDAPPLPSEIVPNLPTSLDEAVVRALAKKPDDRFQSMAEFERALGARSSVSGSSTVLASRAIEPRGGAATGTVGLPTTAKPPNNLPHTTSRFIGRESQIDDVQRRLSESRLVTLVGPGGIGKTRLSLEAAWRVLDEGSGGVWFVELGPLAEPASVPQAMADAVGLREKGDRTPTEALAAWLRDRPVLVVLDNCEHVISGCAEAIDALLHSCPNLRVLATSREPLGISGEVVWSVPTMTVPALDSRTQDAILDRYESTRLFFDRAKLARADLLEPLGEDVVRIAEICRRLDGLPLAIELAAARTRVLSVQQISERLDDRFRLLTGGNRTAPRRHQTLRATIDWSYDALSEDTRTVFRRVAVFAGGFTLDAAEAVVESDVDRLDVLDQLDRLVGTSLILVDVPEGHGPARYRLLESVREYAAERLRESGEADALAARHGNWFLDFAQRANPELTGPRQSHWIGQLEAERDNLNAALRWSLDEAQDAEAALRFCHSLGRFWSAHGHLTEGRGWLRRVLAIDGLEGHPLRPFALLWAAQLARLQSDMPEAERQLDASLALAERLGDLVGVAAVFNERTSVALAAHGIEEARTHAEKALRLFTENSDRRGIGLASTHLGIVACEDDDFDAAVIWFDRALATLREVGDKRSLAPILNNLGRIAAMRGDFARARELIGEGLAITMDLGDRTSIGFFSHSLALIAARAGDYESARHHLAESLPAYREFDSVANIAEVLESAASVAVLEGDGPSAIRLVGAAMSIRATSGVSASTVDETQIQSDLETARSVVGSDHFENLLAEGRATSMEEAIYFVVEAARHGWPRRDVQPERP